MPHFTAISLDRVVEPGSRNPNSKPPLMPVRLGSECSYSGRKIIPSRPPHARSPSLYATPDVTPLPGSPSSFSPSPYIVDHKRRGPRLLKSLSRTNVVSTCDSQPCTLDPNRFPVEMEPATLQLEMVENGNGKGVLDDPKNGVFMKEGNGKSAVVEKERDAELEDLLDFLDPGSTTSNAEADILAGGERSWKPSTPVGEYYDAFEEISSDGVPRSPCSSMEGELCEMRLNLLTEVERRKQAEEALERLRNQWQILRHQLSLVGLTLPAIVGDNAEQPIVDPAEEVYRQVLVARFVSGSVARACSRAEVEMEMEPRIESKNFEIARLSDRLQYYEAANREMSERNQEAIDMARRNGHRRKRRQRWIWISIGLAATLGSAAIAWSYVPAWKSSSHESKTSTGS